MTISDARLLAYFVGALFSASGLMAVLVNAWWPFLPAAVISVIGFVALCALRMRRPR